MDVNEFRNYKEALDYLSLISYRDGCEPPNYYQFPLLPTSLISYRDGCEHMIEMIGKILGLMFNIIQRWM